MEKDGRRKEGGEGREERRWRERTNCLRILVVGGHDPSLVAHLGIGLDKFGVAEGVEDRLGTIEHRVNGTGRMDGRYWDDGRDGKWDECWNRSRDGEDGCRNGGGTEAKIRATFCCWCCGSGSIGVGAELIEFGGEAYIARVLVNKEALGSSGTLTLAEEV